MKINSIVARTLPAAMLTISAAMISTTQSCRKDDETEYNQAKSDAIRHKLDSIAASMRHHVDSTINAIENRADSIIDSNKK